MSKSNMTSPMREENSTKLKFDIYYTDNIGERRVVDMELPLKLSSNFTAGFGARRTTTSTPWYYSWIFWVIAAAALIVFYALYKKYSEKIRGNKGSGFLPNVGWPPCNGMVFHYGCGSD